MDLYVIRHAKSSWKNSGEIADINRPLALRGLNDAQTMSKRLRKDNVHFDKILTSTGIRALHTAVIFTKHLDVDPGIIQIKSSLYLPSRYEILEAIQSLQDDVNCAALFAHDPGISDFAYHSTAEMDHVVTTGVLHYKLNAESWKDASFENLLFQTYDFPKNKIS